jgi:hypothetical protein
MSSIHHLVRDAIKADLPDVVQQVKKYRQLVEQNAKQGQLPPTLSDDIINLCISLSTSITRDRRDARQRRRLSLQQDSKLHMAAREAAEWLLAESALLVQDSHTQALREQSADGCLPMLDFCALVFTLHDFEAVLGQGDVLELAESAAQHAALRLQLGDTPPSVQAWKDLLYGLTMAGLMVSTDRAARRGGFNNTHMQQLMDASVEHLPAVLGSQRAEARNVSLTFLAYAYAGYTGDLGPVTQALASNLEGCLQNTHPQNLANILRALGKLSECWRHGTHPTHVHSIFSWALTKLGEQLQQGQRQLKSQDISNSVYSCALACHTEGLPQFLSVVCDHLEVMNRAEPQHWANTVWGIGALYEVAAQQGSTGEARELQQYGRLLLARCVQTFSAMRGVRPQHWSNIVWAAARLGCLQEGALLLGQLANNRHLMQKAIPRDWLKILWAAATLRQYQQDLFTQAMQELSAMPIVPQYVSNTLWACAMCAHWDSGVQQLLGRVREADTAQFSAQDLAKTAWAWAVLACLAQEDKSYDQHEQCFQQVAVGLFKTAALQPVSSFPSKSRRQLYQAHLFAGYLGIPGLPAGQVLEAAMEAGLTPASSPSRRHSQQEVSSALRQMGYTTELDGLSPDGLMRAHVVITALPDGSPCSIAVEFDGSPHYVAEHTASNGTVARLAGPTRLRNALLSRSFPDGVMCIYWRDWAAVDGDQGAQEEYLSKALAKMVRDKVGARHMCWWSACQCGG